MHYVNKLFDDLREQGYKCFIVLKNSRSKVLLTKAQMENNTFKDEDVFDEFKLNKIENSIFKVFPRNTFITF